MVRLVFMLANDELVCGDVGWSFVYDNFRCDLSVWKISDGGLSWLVGVCLYRFRWMFLIVGVGVDGLIGKEVAQKVKLERNVLAGLRCLPWRW
jgi:hypothetical protein